MSKQDKNKVIALCVTIAVHAIVVLLLVKMALRTPLPLPGEAGVEVNLGMYKEGMGVEQPKKPTKVVETPKPKPQPKKQETVTQDTEETPAVDNKEPEKVEPQTNDKALFKMPTKTQEQPTSEGKTENPGDQGNENGTDNSENYEEQGGSATYDLGGRHSIGNLPLPDIKRDNEQQGTRIVVINIWVNREGIVAKAEVNYKKTSANSNLDEREKSKQAAYSSRFSPADQDAPELQQGTITYTYKQTN